MRPGQPGGTGLTGRPGSGTRESGGGAVAGWLARPRAHAADQTPAGRPRESSNERRTPVRGQRHAHHGAAGPVRRYLDPRFKDRVILPIGKDGRPRRGTIVIDGLPTTRDAELQQYRKRARPGSAHSTQPLSGSRLADTGRLDFAIERDYDAVAQVMGMAMEGVDIAVLYPTAGLSLIAATISTRGSPSPSVRPTTTGSPTSAGTARTSSSSWRCCRCTTCIWPAASWCGASGSSGRWDPSSPESRERALLALELLGSAV